MSSLDPKDAISDYSSLNETQMKTLDQWDSFFAKVGSPALGRTGAGGTVTSPASDHHTSQRELSRTDIRSDTTLSARLCPN